MIGPPSSGIVLGTLFLLAADLRRHPTRSNTRVDVVSSRSIYFWGFVFFCTVFGGGADDHRINNGALELYGRS